jgi:tRNA(Arg) A34 adenosine deaminase TadA
LTLPEKKSTVRIDNKRDAKFLDEAISLARAGDRVGGARIGALLVIGNRVVSMGQNVLKSHPMQKRFGKNADAIYQHAEINCIVNFLRRARQEDFSRATLYVARAFGEDARHVGLAKPCKGCSKAIREFGIKRIVHT